MYCNARPLLNGRWCAHFLDIPTFSPHDCRDAAALHEGALCADARVATALAPKDDEKAPAERKMRAKALIMLVQGLADPNFSLEKLWLFLVCGRIARRLPWIRRMPQVRQIRAPTP